MNPENMIDLKFGNLFSRKQLREGDKMSHFRKIIDYIQDTGVTLITGKADDEIH